MLASRHVTTHSRPAADRQRKGPRDVRARTTAPADGRERPHLDLRRGPPDADPRQGQGAQRDCRCSGSSRPRDIVANHLISATDGVPAEVRGRACSCAGCGCCPVECVVRGYITGSGLEGLPGDRRRSRASTLPQGLRESERLPEPIFTPYDEGRRGPRRGDRLRRAPPSWSATAALMERVGGRLDRAVRVRAPSTRARTA